MAENQAAQPENQEVSSPDIDRAGRFAELHVHIPRDYDTYFQEICEQWVESAEDALEDGKSIRPMWLRRNAADTSEFSAHIDYFMPMEDEPRYFAAIDISSDGGVSEIQVWMPSPDGSGEPVVASTEVYTLESLGRAVEYVERAVQPSR